jgi:CRISPR-associated protein (TIGR03986 family)
MLPEHAETIPPTRAAVAPYNFVTLPDHIVPAEPETQALLTAQDRYHPQPERYTGTITCTLTTESLLYVRCGMPPETFAQYAETAFNELPPKEQERRAQFFHYPNAEQPVIPGSSLRGMLRTLVEIASFSKVEQVTDRPRYFFRAVAAKGSDPLKDPYKDTLKGVRAGYLVQRGRNWYIRPATTIGKDTYLKVRERDIPDSFKVPEGSLIPLDNDHDYRLQRIPVSFTHKRVGKGRLVVDRIDLPKKHPQRGLLVTSGNMKETGAGGGTDRKNHYVVLPANQQAELLRIDPQAIDDYRAGLTDFQKEQPLFDEQNGMLRDGAPVFYCQPQRRRDVIYFGHSPNFRLPYRLETQSRAATPADFVPVAHRDPKTVDIAEALFGFVRRADQQNQREQACASRVFISDAVLVDGQTNVLVDDSIIPHILSSPRPTTFQHYLVQPDSRSASLKHYGNTPGKDTVIRGHKLYWHQGETPDIEMSADELEKTNETQRTKLRPVKPHTRFTFRVRFENLSRVEVGALLWVLRLCEDERHQGKRYRFKLGMGKPLGMGAIHLTHTVQFQDRVARYRTLFADAGEGGWQLGEHDPEQAAPIGDDCENAFTTYVLKHVLGQESPGSLQLKELPRITMLLTLLRWPGPQSSGTPESYTRYMEIERMKTPRIGTDPNEYTNRRVLPRPDQVVRDAAHGEDYSDPPASSASSLGRNERSGQRGGNHKPGANRQHSGKKNSSRRK